MSDDLSYDDKSRLDAFFQWLNSTEIEVSNTIYLCKLKL